MTYLLLYDEDCGFCRFAVKTILAGDSRGRVLPMALQDPGAAKALRGMDHAQMMRSWHLVSPRGEIASAGAAVPVLFRLLWFGRPVAALAEIFPRTRDRVYAWVASHRAVLGRWVGARACDVRPERRPPGRLGGASRETV